MEAETKTRRLRMYKSKALEHSVLALTVVLFFYNWYRYPFKINSTGTSPTYGNTPPVISAFKYVLILALVLYLVFRLGHNRLGLWPERMAWILTYAYLFTIPVVYGVLTASIPLIESGFFFLIPLCLHFAGPRFMTAKHLFRVLKWILAAALVVEAGQVAARVLWDRLPALAYPGPFFLSRFGSFLDDPNGFGIIVALLLGYAAFAFRGWRQRLVLLGLAACLLLTVSFTALAAVPASALCLWFVAGSGRTRLRIAIVVAVLVLALIAVWISSPVLRESFFLLMSRKQGSVNGHLEQLSQRANRLTFLNLTGLVPNTGMIESGYADMLASTGLLYLMVFLGSAVLCARRYASLVTAKRLSPEARAIAGGAFCFLIASLLGTTNLPLQQIFPVNGLLAMLMGLASSRAIFEFRVAELDPVNMKHLQPLRKPMRPDGLAQPEGVA